MVAKEFGVSEREFTSVVGLKFSSEFIAFSSSSGSIFGVQFDLWY